LWVACYYIELNNEKTNKKSAYFRVFFLVNS